MKKNLFIEYPKNYAKMYPLHAACRRGDDEKVQELINAQSEQPSYVNKKDNKGRTALMIAILEDEEDIVSLLFKHDASAHIPDKTGQTCLIVTYLPIYILDMEFYRKLPSQRSSLDIACFPQIFLFPMKNWSGRST